MYVPPLLLPQVSLCHTLQQVKVILVNIFGGIVDCSTIANGIIRACREIQLKLPLVVRLEGEKSRLRGEPCVLYI